MSVNPSIESDSKKQLTKSFEHFEQAHKEEITAVSLIVAKITNRSFDEVKSHLDTMLSSLVEINSSSSNTSERAREFREWVESHKNMNLPSLSDEAISRESIYGERG
jgi:dihydroorotate dehydrogenase